MKQVLIIDAPPQFRDFLKEKLTSVGVEIAFANGRRDSFTKTISLLPDLIIIDFQTPFSELLEFLEKKRDNPNAVTIPVIVTGKPLAPELLTKLLPLKVIKYFNRPIKFDVFFESVSKVLHTTLSIDTTPSIVETHLNNNILFIEIAKGLNRDKLAMISYKISETIDANRLSNPKIVLMLTNITLNYADSVNLELLLENVVSDQRVRHRHIKVLSFDSFTREFIKGHEEYKQLEVVDNLADVLNTFIEDQTDINEENTIADRILVATEDEGQELIEMRFFTEADESANKQVERKKLHIAIVDDDETSTDTLIKAFEPLFAQIDTFKTGADFLNASASINYTLIILDIIIPDISGFNILMNLRSKQYQSPVLIYSKVSQKEAVVQALSLGAKAYLVKPLKSEEIVQKATEIINENS